jgi:hypothetical protein
VCKKKKSQIRLVDGLAPMTTKRKSKISMLNPDWSLQFKYALYVCIVCTYVRSKRGSLVKNVLVVERILARGSRVIISRRAPRRIEIINNEVE